MKRPGGQTGQRTRSVANNAKKNDSETLKKALLAPENSIKQLIPWLAEQRGAQVQVDKLQADRCQILDFRPEWQETQPSLSLRMGDTGIIVKRFGGDEFSGGIVDFVADVLRIPQARAAKLLIQRAGLAEVSKVPKSKAHAPEAQITGETKSRPSNTQFRPITPEVLARATNGWTLITPEMAASAPADIRRRGLWPAVSEGRLRAYTRPDLPTMGLQPGAWLFEVTGPGGQAYNLKARNGPPPGEGQVGYHRYRYMLSGYGTPAWCSGNFSQARDEIWVEGELNGVALAEALQGEEIAVQGLAGHGGSPHTNHFIYSKRNIFIYVDPDEKNSDETQKRWLDLARKYGKGFLLPPDLFPEGDACDALGAVGAEILKTRVLAAIELSLTNPPNEHWVDDRHGYGIEKGRMVAYFKKRMGENSWTETEVLTEFTAFIAAEVSRDDGSGELKRELEMVGFDRNGKPLGGSRERVKLDELRGMNWPSRLWGNAAIVHAGNGKRDRAGAAIQLFSQQRGVVQRVIFGQTGWRFNAALGWVYLSNGAVINAQGAVEGVEVDLTDGIEKGENRLRDFALPAPPTGEVLKAAVRASLDLFDLAPDDISAAMLGTVYRAPLGRLNTTVVFTGRTGRYKTTFLALGMAHFGAKFTRDHLPEGWQSSLVSLQMATFKLADCLVIIDDYKPDANQKTRSETIAKASSIINSVADGVGRSTMTANREFRPNTYPRGTVMTSAEDVPVGEGVQARCLIVPVAESLQGDHLEKRPQYEAAEALAREAVFSSAMAGYIQYLAQRHDEVIKGSPRHLQHIKAHSGQFQGRHPRTGPACADLTYGWQMFLEFAVAVGAITGEEADTYWQRVLQGLAYIAGQQGSYQVEQDPVKQFLDVVNSLFLQGLIHVVDKETGDVPGEFPQQLGWRRHVSHDGDGVIRETFSHAPNSIMVGWSGGEQGRSWLYLIPNAIYTQVQQVATRQVGGVFPQKTTLWARLKERLESAGLMKCYVEKRGEGTIMRTTHKVTVHGHSKQQQLLTLLLPLDTLSLESGISGESGIEVIENSFHTEETEIPLPPSPEPRGGIGGIEAAQGDSEGDDSPLPFKTLVI